MAQPGGTKGIVSIPVDSAEFDAFLDKFMSYQKLLEDQPEVWRASSKGIKATKTAWDDVGTSFDKVVRAAVADKFSSPTSGAFAKVQKSARETEKSWLSISREIERADKSLQGMVRNGMSLNSVFGLFGSAGLLAGGVFGATAAAANSVAGDYKSSRQLGLQLGQEKEFSITGEPYGLGRDQLEDAANAKADPRLQTPFRNAGVTDFNQDAAELAWQKAEGEAKLYSQWQKVSPEFAYAQAQSYFPGENPDQLRLEADAYDKGDLQKAHDQYEQDWKKVGYSEQQGEAATAFKQDMSQKWADVETAWNRDILLLAPHLDKWADAAVGLTTKFLDATAKTVDDLADAGDHPYPPGTKPPPVTGNTNTERAASWLTNREVVLGQWLQEHGMVNPFNSPDAAATSQAGFTLDPDKRAHMAALEKAAGLPPGMLQAIENNESSGGVNNTNPKNPNVLGAFQFDDPTAKAYGVDRHNEYSGEVGATRKLDDLYAKYHDWDAAAAAYDGFGGLDKDIAKYGLAHWKEHISEYQTSGETEQYLRKLDWQGVDMASVQKPTGWDNKRAITESLDSGEEVVANPQQPPKTSTASPASLNDFTDRLREALQPVRDLFSEGGGARFAQPAPAANQNPRQYGITVNVNAPPGHDVAVSTTQLAQ